ncbi:hypothetical protein Nmel_014657, partial [Mimus melanotis]
GAVPSGRSRPAPRCSSRSSRPAPRCSLMELSPGPPRCSLMELSLGPLRCSLMELSPGPALFPHGALSRPRAVPSWSSLPAPCAVSSGRSRPAPRLRSERGAIRVAARPWRRWRSSKQVGAGAGDGDVDVSGYQEGGRATWTSAATRMGLRAAAGAVPRRCLRHIPWAIFQHTSVLNASWCSNILLLKLPERMLGD